MSNNETVIVFILAIVVVVALSKFGERVRRIMIQLPWIKVLIDAVSQRELKKKPIRPSHSTRPWFSRHWRALLIEASMLLILVAPVWWWFNQPAPWRMLLWHQLQETFSLLRRDPHGPVTIARGRATLDGITDMVEMRADTLNSHYLDDEIWVVDHFWQYWNTENLRPYLSANKTFVAKGGRIHRMFFLTREELQNPGVQAMLQAQCRIGKLGDDQTGNGFELWRADPAIMKNQEEYQTISRQFRQLPDTSESFQNFDFIQFKDTLYYSSDFSTDYRVLGSSTWLFDPDQVSKIDVRPLFKKNIAERISCDPGLGQPAVQPMKTLG